MTPEPLLVKDECQWQEESQADPSVMRHPLHVICKSEVLGGQQEARPDDRVCECLPGPDTSENALCCRVDTWPALAVLTPGSGAVGRVSALCQPALRKRTDGHAMDHGLSLEQAHSWPLPCVIFCYVSLIFFGTLI